MLDETVVVLDFETTGLRADLGDRVTEVAALRLRGDRIVGRFQALVNCGRRLPHHIVKFTGITQEMVDSAPPSAQVFPDLLDFIGNDPVIAHNAAFDQGFLAHECERLHLPYRHREFICSVKIARFLFPDLRTHALGALACSLGMQFTPGAHRAGTDAEVTAAVLVAMAKLLRKKSPSILLDANTLRGIADVRISSAA